MSTICILQKELKKLIPEITYKKINDWEEKGLIKPHRYTENTGWRRFSLSDIVAINLIVDMRKVGYGINYIRNKIKYIFKVIFNGKLEEYYSNTRRDILVIPYDGIPRIVSDDISDFRYKRAYPLMLFPINTYIKEAREALWKSTQEKNRRNLLR